MTIVVTTLNAVLNTTYDWSFFFYVSMTFRPTATHPSTHPPPQPPLGKFLSFAFSPWSMAAQGPM